MISCRQFADFVSSYLDRELSAENRREFEQHLVDCSSCVEYLKTFQTAIRMGRQVFASRDEPLPGDIPEELVRAVMAGLKKNDDRKGG